MGVFFQKQRSVPPTVRNELRQAFNTAPPADNQLDQLVNVASARAAPPLRIELRRAFQTAVPNNDDELDQLTTEAGQRVIPATGTGKQFSVGRFIGAVILVVLIFLAGIWTARDPQLKGYSDALLHFFQVLLGIIIGLVTGEAASSD